MDISIAQVIGLAVKLSILATVFAIGLLTTWESIAYLLRKPRLFVRSLLAMYGLTPLIAVLLVLVVPAPRSVQIAVLLMAISAGAPALPKKLLKLGANAPYVHSLAVITALLAIVTVPLSLAALGTFFNRDVSVTTYQAAVTITSAFLAPLLAGMVMRSVAPILAERMAEPIMTIAGTVMLVLGLLIVATNVVAILDVGPSGLAMIVLMTFASLAVGHLLGGPDPKDRTTLAIACASRFPGLGLLIASMNFPNFKPLPIVVTYLLISSVAAIPYVKWRKTETV